MKDNFIVDAHMHIGPPGVFFSPKYDTKDYISLMDESHIAYSICSDQPALMGGVSPNLENTDKLFEQSSQRIYILSVFNPKYTQESIVALERMTRKPYLVGIKIHPSMHGVDAESDKYESVWNFASENDLTIMSHTWSISPYNPVQKYSTPLKFEKFVKKFPNVRFVMGHFGGRGDGRNEAMQLINDYPNVYGDFAGDIYDYELIENLVASVPSDRILFGSDYPWFDPKANTLLVLLSKVSDEVKLKILRENAVKAYNLKFS